MQAAPRTEKALLNLLQNQTVFSHHNAFISRASPSAVLAQWSKTQTQSPLKNVAIAVKDNICTADLPTTCASKTLDGFKSPFDATVVRKIRDAGGIILGKTNLDEFGMGSHNLNSAFGATSPVETSLSAGGSSGGSAVAVATDQCEGALGTDTGGSVRLPAAYNGVLGFKPSYGLVSRWGVVAYANSLDTVGFLAKTPDLVRAMFDVCNGNDPNDPTSLSNKSRERIYDTIHSRSKDSHLRIGFPIEYNLEELSPVVRSAWSNILHMLRKEGHSIHPVSIPVSKDALSAYYILGPAEASSNLAKYDNVRYGNDQLQESHQLFAKARGEGFGEEVQRRILLGAYSLSAGAIDNYFIKAQKIRRLVQTDFDKVFALPNMVASHPLEADRDGSVDCLICPTSTGLAPKVEEIKAQSPLEQYAGDVLTVPANLAGLPAINVPIQTPTGELEGEPKPATVGMQIITQYGDDYKALDLAALLLDLQR